MLVSFVAHASFNLVGITAAMLLNSVPDCASYTLVGICVILLTLSIAQMWVMETTRRPERKRPSKLEDSEDEA